MLLRTSSSLYYKILGELTEPKSTVEPSERGADLKRPGLPQPFHSNLAGTNQGSLN